MRTIFNTMRIRSMQIETQSQLAEVQVEYYNDKVLIETTLILGSTDINQLMVKFSQQGIDISLSEDFDVFHTREAIVYYADFCEKGWNEVVIENFMPVHSYHQIRA